MTDPAFEVFDTDHLAMACGDDLSFQREIVDEFSSQLGPGLEDIAVAVAAPNAEAIHQTAHALKGAAMTLGAPALTEACARLEALGRAGDLAGAPPAFEQVRREAARLRSALDAFLDERAA